MKPYCRNNSNFTFREITCAPIKKDCDNKKDRCDCGCDCGCNHNFHNDCFSFVPYMDDCFCPPPKPCEEKKDCICKRPIIIILNKKK